MQFCTTKLKWQPSEFRREAPQTVLKQLQIYKDTHSEHPEPTNETRLIQRKRMLDRMGRKQPTHS